MSRTLWGGHKVITGEVIHREFLACCDYRLICVEWDELSRVQREMYNKVANRLNAWLEQEENENELVQSSSGGLNPA